MDMLSEEVALQEGDYLLYFSAGWIKFAGQDEHFFFQIIKLFSFTWHHDRIILNIVFVDQSSKLDFRIYWPEFFFAKVTGPNQFSLAVGHRTTAKVDDC